MPVRGFTCGCFDPFPHPGHILMLEEAKEHCDHLVVGLHSDPSIERPLTKHRPLLSVPERRIMVEAIRYVDEIMVYETEADLVRILETANIDLRIIGADYEGKSFTGDHLDIPVVYNRRDHDWSSTNFLSRIQGRSEQNDRRAA